MRLTLTMGLEAIVATLAPVLAPVPVESHGGQFTENELALVLGKAPCVLIAPLSVSAYTPTARDQWQATVAWGAYCIGSDASGQRAEQALDLAQTLLEQLHDPDWGWDATMYDTFDYGTVRADNLYSGHINNLRVAVWTVSWAQTLFFTLA